MIIDDVHRGITKNRKRKRIGRGTGSGHGKTSGRGHKGYGSRSGSSTRVGFEGGQTPIFMRVAKRGFNNRAFADKVAIINVRDLEKAFNDGDTVSPEALRTKGLIHGHFDAVKLLADGEITKKLTVQVHRFSASAEEKIVKAGGKLEAILA
ncbi:50S ribosomal protein L15 [Rubinisphaera brasiliensis]|uniref:Large ribosomal subunit protein uL15 n=1 Tax=Rubinisphaera brasiliensis (strain ATCC 49424 / DSM 5305 / JCM 21570 / IAM 15109 / NBRC 103401 / IFAM 1448) TaxID=756272 RepID=F0SJA3_RUBBR|nr:50S ribosomal protein L15 [Rubinisphaera brasiliensis]ADY59678.1 LSU ribosomal protein L15P [Rubinisphaera brasiliensis DSM 5305]